MKTRKLDPAVYIKAAEFLDKQPKRIYHGACWGIWNATANFFDYNPYEEEFSKLFRPTMLRDMGNIFWLWDIEMTPEQNQKRRVLTLLLCAEIVRDYDL